MNFCLSTVIWSPVGCNCTAEVRDIVSFRTQRHWVLKETFYPTFHATLRNLQPDKVLLYEKNVPSFIALLLLPLGNSFPNTLPQTLFKTQLMYYFLRKIYHNDLCIHMSEHIYILEHYNELPLLSSSS